MTEAVFIFTGVAPMILDGWISILMGISISAIDAQSKGVFPLLISLTFTFFSLVRSSRFMFLVEFSLIVSDGNLVRRGSFTDFVPSKP